MVREQNSAKRAGRATMEAVFTPMISHLACELDQQRRLRERALEARVRSASRRGSRRRRRPGADFASDLARSGEDVWKAFRF